MSLNKDKKTILEEAIMDANQIFKEAEKNAKDQLAKSLPEELEKLVKESLQKKLMESECEIDTVISPVDKTTETEPETNDLTEEEIKDLEEALKEMEQKIQNTEKPVEKIKESEPNIEGLSIGENKPEDSGEATIDPKMLKELEIALSQDENPENTPEATTSVVPDVTSTETVATAPEVQDTVTTTDDGINFSDQEISDMLKEIGLSDEKPVDESGLAISNNNSKKSGAEITGPHSDGKLQHERPAVKDALDEENKKLKAKNAKLEDDKKELLSINEGFQKTSNELRQKLNEMAVLHTNTAHVNKIFVENATTINEKKDIVKRFKDIQSIDESKQIYKAVITELQKTPSIQEQIENKTSKNVQSGSVSVITESTAYSDNPVLQKIKRLMIK
ncbi:MAG TPA: hypothetical protein VNX68_13905 [Nitrosopumilaceae archaeon]|jgi:hypothetical protein|nr:hypothetical protein [Nitrosopumilaceae archaeon]